MFGGGKKNTDDADIETGKSRDVSNNSLPSTAESSVDDEGYEVGQDVYALIFVSPVCSFSFLYAWMVILLKYSLFLFLGIDMYQRNVDDQQNGFLTEKSWLIRATQFLLLPIAIALQEDLIYVYTRIANIKYGHHVKEVAKDATKAKFTLSFVLRLLDGLFSLTINFVLIMTTDEVLALFLNFAALHFLQGIDDIFFQLGAEGFVGDGMEDRCKVVQDITMARRAGDPFTNSLDTILFVLTYLAMLAVWIYVFIHEEAATGS